MTIKKKISIQDSKHHSLKVYLIVCMHCLNFLISQLTEPTIIWFSTCDCTKLILTKFNNDLSENHLKCLPVTCENLLALVLVVPPVPSFPLLFLLCINVYQQLNANVLQVLAFRVFVLFILHVLPV